MNSDIEQALEKQNFELKAEIVTLKRKLYEAKELCVKRGADIARLYNEVVLLEARILELQKPILLVGPEENTDREEPSEPSNQ